MSPFDGRRVAVLVAVVVMLTAVIPPGAAYALARWRVTRAEALARDAVPALLARRDQVREAVGAEDVACGQGQLPRGEGPGTAWVRTPARVRDGFGVLPPDPWGRCYLLDVRGMLLGAGGLLLSAGQNGTVETPLAAAAPAGDDIAVLVR